MGTEVLLFDQSQEVQPVADLQTSTDTSENGIFACGMRTIALSGVAGGRAAKLTENALYHRPLDQGLWNPGDIARDALLAVGGTWLFGSAANALTGKNTNYFTAFLPRSFVDLMPASEAARYRGYWDEVAGGWVESKGSNPQQFVGDLSNVTGNGAAARNRAIKAIIAEDLPDLDFTYEPQYSPYVRTGLAKRGVGTHIGKNVFYNRQVLRTTIVHEELHHRWWSRGYNEWWYDATHHHSPVDFIPNERFYQVVERYFRFRGWGKPE